ncbi:MAG: CRISPR-associated helicase Cas3' [Acutalibacteraceae bacterium]
MKYKAHIRESDRKAQTVEEHCKEVAIIAEQYVKKLGLKYLPKLQAYLHDAGKLTSDFNSYISGKSEFRRGDIDHCFAGARFICELADGYNDKNIYLVSRFIARTIISHHGLHDWVNECGEDYFSYRVSKADRYDEIRQNINDIFDESELRHLLEKSAEEYSEVRKKIKAISPNPEIFAFYLGMFERFMESVLIDADRTNTADFMSDSKTQKEFDTAALWENMHNRLEHKLKAFEHKTDPISVQRRSISDRCVEFAKNNVGVCRLIVPTGGGKTLSSLRFAIDYCKANNMDKIIYVAPFMSILEQNGDEIREVAGEENFLEHHSNIIQEISTKEELSEYELRTEKWDSPVIATTMVQFFNSLFLGKTSSVRRMHRLSRAVIIIDEVQSVPLKCVHLFNLAINFLTKICGSTVVLCSATQPVFEELKYPLILDENSSMTGDYSQDFERFRRTRLVSQITKAGYTYDEAAGFCYDKYLESGSLLVVVNTKKSAAMLYELIKSKNETAADSDKAVIIHLSTNMCPQHRREIIASIRNMRKEKQRVVCVTTQLIEAGVDISFDCVVRSLAGMDNAAQAAGRCNRNGENASICPVYIINIREENISKMNELKTAQSVSRLIIDNGKFTDLLSVDTMTAYYSKFYNEQKESLSYKVGDSNKSETLINLLSLNKYRYNLRAKPELRYCAQAFQTAGNVFKIIDENTEDIIVAYNKEAEELILKLNSDITPQETVELLRTAQKYTVGVYPNLKKALDEAGALTKLKCGAIALNDGFYDASIGATVKRGEQPVLFY